MKKRLLAYAAAGLASLGLAACEGTIFDTTAKGEGYLSDVRTINGYQILEVDIRRDAGDSFEPPPLVLPSPTEAPIHLVLASKKPIEDAQAGGRLKFRYAYDKDKSKIDKQVHGWTRPKWCKVYPKM
jgi:hypothetical protein